MPELQPSRGIAGRGLNSICAQSPANRSLANQELKRSTVCLASGPTPAETGIGFQALNYFGVPESLLHRGSAGRELNSSRAQSPAARS